MRRAIVSLSGGMDSTTVLGMVKQAGTFNEITTVSFFYGSKHGKAESVAAYNVADYYSTRHIHIVVNIASLYEQMNLAGSSALLNPTTEVPIGHYQEENMRLTNVPGRNTIFTGILLGLAQELDADSIYLGIHSGDHFIYPDCRPEWFGGMVAAVYAASDRAVELYAPYLKGDKTSMIKDGLSIGVPYHLTRTCYTSDTIACGKCGSCQERLEAFRNNHVEDPIPYQSRELLPKSSSEGKS